MSSSSQSSPPQYSRICLANTDDIEATYPLLASYAVNPSTADSVREFVLDGERWSDRRYTHLDPPDKSVNHAAHELLEKRARSLGLSEKSTEKMLMTLSWKKKHLLGENPACPDGFETHNKEYADTAATLLLSFCKNITHLYPGYMSTESVSGEYLLKSNYGLIATENRALQKLETVEVVSTDKHAWDIGFYQRLEYFECLSMFHRLPNFRTFIADGTGDYQMHRYHFAPRTSSPSLKRIQLRFVDLAGDDIGTIIRIPQGLEELVVSYGGQNNADYSNAPYFYQETVGKCLFTQKETLRVLDLDVKLGLSRGEEPECDCDSDDDMCDCRDSDDEICDCHDPHVKEDMQKDEYFQRDLAESTGPLSHSKLPTTREYGLTIGSMHDFAALTHLSISIEALLGPLDLNTPYGLVKQPPFRLVDALPPNLEYLCLYDYKEGRNADLDDHVKEFMSKKDERFPRLAEVSGVDEEVVGEGTAIGDTPDQGDEWDRIRGELRWQEV